MRIRNLIRDFFAKNVERVKRLVAPVKEPEDILSKVIDRSYAARHDGLTVVGHNTTEIYLADADNYCSPGHSRSNFCFAVKRNYSCGKCVAPFWSGILHEQNDLPALQGILSKLPPANGHVRISLSFGDLETLDDGTEIFRFCSPMTARYVFLEYWTLFVDSQGRTDSCKVEHWLEQEKPDNLLRTKSTEHGKNFYFYFQFNELLHETEAELLELRKQFEKAISNIEAFSEIGGIEVLDPSFLTARKAWSSPFFQYRPLSSCR